MKTKDITLSGFGILLISICAQITIQLPLIPFTLQMFAITLIALLFNRKNVFFTLISYLLLGMFGLPVFSGFKGGFQVVLSPSFGFLLGFILYGYLLSTSSSSNQTKHIYLRFIRSYIAFYLLSLCIVALNFTYILKIQLDSLKFVSLYWFTFIPTDLLSVGLAFFIHKKLKKILK